MPTRPSKRWLDKCPTPGTPADLWTDYDRAMWTGLKKDWTIPTTLCVMTLPSGQRQSFHVCGTADKAEILANAKGAPGLGPEERALIRRWQAGETDHEFHLRRLRRQERRRDEQHKTCDSQVARDAKNNKYKQRVADAGPATQRAPMNARQIVEMFRSGGATFAFSTASYNGKTEIPSVYKRVWEAAVMLQTLVCDIEGGCTLGEYEQRTSGGTDKVNRITLALLLDNIPDGYDRMKWFKALGNAECKTLGMGIIARAESIITNPPQWSWWAGSPGRAEHFVERNSFVNRRTPVGVKSWSFRACALRTLAKRWVGPETDLSKSLGLGYSNQQQLDMLNSGVL